LSPSSSGDALAKLVSSLARVGAAGTRAAVRVAADRVMPSSAPTSRPAKTDLGNA
jgi:hypothetical protein